MQLYNLKTSNEAEICWQIVKRNGLSVNKETILGKFAEHPYPDSLVAISDILGEYGIKTASYNIEKVDALASYDGAFIVLVHIKSGTYFSIVETISQEYVLWYNPVKHRREKIFYDDFKKRYGGIVVFYDVQGYIGETEYKKEKGRNFVQRCVESIPVVVFLMVLAVVFIHILMSGSPLSMGFYVTGLGIGSVLCTYLLGLKINGDESSLLAKLCPVGSKWDCSAVLNSNASQIYGIDWSAIGLTYFAGTLLALICTGATEMDCFILSADINALSLPFIIYSLYYQIAVSKRWCVMCLSVLTVLVFLFIISLYGGYLSLHLELLRYIAPFVVAYFVVLWGTNMYVSLCKRNKSYSELFPAFNRLRFTKSVFHTLLGEEPLVADIPANMSINIGKATAPVKLLKVCDPYCRACSKSHLKMEDLLKNKDVRLQVIFNVSSKDDKTVKTVKLFFGLKEKFGDRYMSKVLHDWYSQKEKNYEEFRKKYDIDEKLINMQEDKIMWMEQKTRELRVEYTPTFYINNRHMPDDYYSYNDFGLLFS